MPTDELRLAFAQKVRDLYIDHFGEDAAVDEEPAVLGPILLMMEESRLDGETNLHTFWAGSYNSCKGMAWRFLADDFRVEED